MKEKIEEFWNDFKLVRAIVYFHCILIPRMMKEQRLLGLEMSQKIIRMFIDNDIKPGERLEVIFKDESEEYVNKVFYEIEGESSLQGIPFEVEEKKYQLFYEADDSYISAINPYDSLFIVKLYCPFEQRFAPQEK